MFSDIQDEEDYSIKVDKKTRIRCVVIGLVISFTAFFVFKTTFLMALVLLMSSSGCSCILTVMWQMRKEEPGPYEIESMRKVFNERMKQDLKYLAVLYEMMDRREEERRKLEYYQICVKYKITNISNFFQRSAAEYYAAQFGDMTRKEFEEFFRSSQEIGEAWREEQENGEVVRLRREEQRKEQRLTQYCDLYGRDKRIKMLEDMQNACTEKSKELGDIIGRLTGVPGGGPAKNRYWVRMNSMVPDHIKTFADFIVDLHERNRHATIKEQTINYCNAVNVYTSRVRLKMFELEDRFMDLEYEIAETEMKHLSETPDETVFQMLKIKTVAWMISKTGACDIKVQVKLEKSPVEDLKDLPLMVDGTIAADIYQNEVLVGTAMMVLPLDGLTDSCSLEGIYRGHVEVGIPCKIRYRPHKLWVMEGNTT